MTNSRIVLGILIPSIFIILFLLSNLFNANLNLKLIDSPEINRFIIGQCVGLLLAIFGIVITLHFAPSSIKWLKFGNVNSLAEPVKFLGIKQGDNWLKTGGGFMVTLSVVTASFMYMGLHDKLDLNKWIATLPYVLLFSLTNSFTEEIISRFMVVGLLDGFLLPKNIMIVAGLIFGIVHYFGTPGGAIGVLMAGFLGWFLAKSVIETHGIGIAWSVHFVLDIIIISVIFNID